MPHNAQLNWICDSGSGRPSVANICVKRDLEIHCCAVDSSGEGVTQVLLTGTQLSLSLVRLGCSLSLSMSIVFFGRALVLPYLEHQSLAPVLIFQPVGTASSFHWCRFSSFHHWPLGLPSADCETDLHEAQWWALGLQLHSCRALLWGPGPQPSSLAL